MKSKTIIILSIIITLLVSCNTNKKDYKKNSFTADSLFKAEKYEEAKAYYSKILKNNPKDSKAKKRIDEIALFLDVNNKEIEYQNALQDADSFYDLENYEEAKLSYEKALTHNPDDEHVKTRLLDIAYFLENDETIEQVSDSNDAYHIIVGCFTIENNALNLQELLKSKGKDSYLIPRGEYTAVTYSSHSNIREAYNSLPKVEDDLQYGAWILKKVLR